MEWLSILTCPITGSDLRFMQADEICLLNSRISTGSVRQLDGRLMTASIEQGLISSNKEYVYPVINEIILLLKDLAIASSADTVVSGLMGADKHWVKNFYDQKGWLTDETGFYTDAIIYEDLREVSRDYIKKCHKRVGRYIVPSGKYLLDAASGAVQYPEYIEYSANYEYRICVDFSFMALSEAKKKMGNKGICILCDITDLPFKDNSIDCFLSLHTVYHIPKNEQVTAIKELYRVLMPKGKGIVVYDWYKHSVWMNIWLLPFRGFVFVKNRITEVVEILFAGKSSKGRLYFYAHPARYFKKHLPPYQIKVWRSVSVPFMQYYIHSWFFGKQILNWIYKEEEKNPEQCGLKGEYPLMVFEKESG